MITKLILSGLTCPSCQKVIMMKIGKIAGVENITVDLKSGETIITSANKIEKSTLVAVLADTHYQIESYD